MTRTIDLTPSWPGVLPLLLEGVRSGTDKGRDSARKEFLRMAKLAQMATEYAKDGDAEKLKTALLALDRAEAKDEQASAILQRYNERGMDFGAGSNSRYPR